MIVLAGLLILLAGALLVGGLGNGETTLLWGSVGVSALAAVALVLQSVRRARAARADTEDDDEPALVAAAAPAADASTPAPPAIAAGTPGETARPSSTASGESTTSSGATPSGGPSPSGEPSAAEIAALRAELAELRSERFGAATSHADVEPAAAEAPAAEPTPTEPPTEPPAVTPAGGPVPAVPAPAGAVPGGSAIGGSDVDEEPAADEPARSIAAAAVAPAARTTSEGPTTGTHAVVRPIVVGEDGEPVEEDVVVTDLLLVIDLTDEVFVVDEHPRYHLEGCAVTEGQQTFGLPLDEAKSDGFTACGICRPDRSLADAERRRRAAARS